jgi:hypothetical protein
MRYDLGETITITPGAQAGFTKDLVDRKGTTRSAQAKVFVVAGPVNYSFVTAGQTPIPITANGSIAAAQGALFDIQDYDNLVNCQFKNLGGSNVVLFVQYGV